MSGATADRLKTVEGKIDHAREVLAQIKSVPQDFRDPQGLMMSTFEKLEGLQREQMTLLGELGDSNGHATSKAWDVEGLNDPRVKTILEGVSASNAPFGRLPIGEAIDGRVLAAQLGTVAKADVAVGSNARRGDFGGVAEQPRRQLSLLDLVSTAPMTGSSLPYLVESGTLDSALEVAEGTAKPEAPLSYADAEAPAATVAHFVKLRKQSLADVDSLRGVIDGRLRYGVLRRLENEIVAGDGTAPNIRGILNTSGIQVQAHVAGPVADQLVRGAVKVFIAGGVANAALVNPVDLEAALLAKTSGSGEYQGSPVFGGMLGLDWTARTIPSTAVPAGRAIVGDFARGATLFIRQGVMVLMSDSDGSDFTSNRVTLLGEMRAALAVWAPSLFVDVDLAA